MSKGSFVPLYFKVHTNEQIYSHSNQSTDATVSTNANDYVIKGEVAKPGWVQMGGESIRAVRITNATELINQMQQ